MPDNVVPLRRSDVTPILTYGLTAGIQRIAADLAESELPTDFETLAAELETARTARQYLGDYERRLEDAMTKAAGRDRRRLTVDHGLWERRGGKERRKWQHRDIAFELMKVARRERIDSMTGEVQMSEGEAVTATLLSCAGIGYWKLNELRGRGIDPDDFCESEAGRVTWMRVDG